VQVGEWEEWGDPLHNRSAYDYIKSYSPIDNVARKVVSRQCLAPMCPATIAQSASTMASWMAAHTS